ncbi:MAG TPA: dephospho-CoA kinase [Terriglobales bacterium]|nr:dephospho-CoA kinase [Terriglobales bacterium]
MTRLSGSETRFHTSKLIESHEALLLKAGLTGGIASGKSVVGEMFAALGAHVVQADLIAHQLLQPGEAVYDEVVRHFGTGILNPDRTVNRARLADAAFGSPNEKVASRVEELNRIVHPAVIQRQEEWMETEGGKDPHGVVMVEAALILEAGAGKRFDRLLVVTCRPEQRIRRWAGRLGLDEEEARREVTRRMAAQWPDEKKIGAADFVIDNSGLLDETRRQVETVYSKLRREAEKKP